MKLTLCRSGIPEKHATVDVESPDMDMVSIIVYYWRVGGQFAMSATKPEHIPEERIHEFTMEFVLSGIFGGPQVQFLDPDGYLLKLTRRGSHTNMSVNLPDGGVTARDGSGDWTKVIDLSRDAL